MNEFTDTCFDSLVSKCTVGQDRVSRCNGGNMCENLCDRDDWLCRPHSDDFFGGKSGNHLAGGNSIHNTSSVTPCFTPGTMVATPRGEVAVEKLVAGDRIVTRDNGAQEIRWVGRRDLSWAQLLSNNHLKPILIPVGGLGNGLPEREMLVSPNHRMLVANDRTQLYFAENEVLVAAKHLVGGEGVRQVDRAGVSYIHFMCDRHQVVLADGAWTESFQPDDRTLKGMSNSQRSEIFEVFPELRTEAGRASYVAVRPTVRGIMARLFES